MPMDAVGPSPQSAQLFAMNTTRLAVFLIAGFVLSQALQSFAYWFLGWL